MHCVPDSNTRCTRLAQMPVATLAACRPSDLGLLPTCGLAQPRLCQFTALQALILTRPDSKECPPHGAVLTCHQGTSNAQEREALRQVNDERSPLCAALQRLRHLDLTNNKLGFDAQATTMFAMQLRRVSNLTFLALRGNPLKGGMLHFGVGVMPYLQHLDLCRCHGLSAAGAMSIRHCPALTHLDLSFTELSGQSAQAAHSSAKSAAIAPRAPVATALSPLSHLRHLNLSHARLQPEDCDLLRSTALTRLSSLTSLLWQQNQREHDHIARDVLVAILLNQMPGLAHLDLSSDYEPHPEGADEPVAQQMNMQQAGNAGGLQLTSLVLKGRSVGRPHMQVRCSWLIRTPACYAGLNSCHCAATCSQLIHRVCALHKMHALRDYSMPDSTIIASTDAMILSTAA